MATGEVGRVYIVDDDESVRDSLRTLLEIYDLPVSGYASAQDFAIAFRPGTAGCLVLDQHMPDMTGLEFLERHGALLRSLPVVMVSGRADTDILERARKAGVAAFLDKPFDADQLVDIVQRLMQPAAA